MIHAGAMVTSYVAQLGTACLICTLLTESWMARWLLLHVMACGCSGGRWAPWRLRSAVAVVAVHTTVALRAGPAPWLDAVLHMLRQPAVGAGWVLAPVALAEEWPPWPTLAALSLSLRYHDSSCQRCAC